MTHVALLAQRHKNGNDEDITANKDKRYMTKYIQVKTCNLHILDSNYECCVSWCEPQHNVTKTNVMMVLFDKQLKWPFTTFKVTLVLHHFCVCNKRLLTKKTEASSSPLFLQRRGVGGLGHGEGCSPRIGCLTRPASHRCALSPTSVSPGASPSPSLSCLCTRHLAAGQSASETSCCFWDRCATEESELRGLFIRVLLLSQDKRMCIS